MGHALFNLKDEYLREGGFGFSGQPNCAPDKMTAQKWWGDLEGQGEGDLKVGYFYGCGSSKEYVRPTNNSVMRYHSLTLEFGPVNERHARKILERYIWLNKIGSWNE
ncbi:MAG: hypothetical protein ABIJ92_04685 [Candidatus Aenigmatarchaeota archaeon]